MVFLVSKVTLIQCVLIQTIILVKLDISVFKEDWISIDILTKADTCVERETLN